MKHIPCSWIGRINIIKISIVPKAMYRFNVVPIKIPMTYITEQIFKNLYGATKFHIATVSLRKKNIVGRIMVPNIKIYYKVVVIKTSWYWHKNRHIDQCNRMESQEINPKLYGQLTFDRRSKHIQ